jgi:hypothetical protein
VFNKRKWAQFVFQFWYNLLSIYFWAWLFVIGLGNCFSTSFLPFTTISQKKNPEENIFFNKYHGATTKVIICDVQTFLRD